MDRDSKPHASGAGSGLGTGTVNISTRGRTAELGPPNGSGPGFSATPHPLVDGSVAGGEASTSDTESAPTSEGDVNNWTESVRLRRRKAPSSPKAPGNNNNNPPTLSTVDTHDFELKETGAADGIPPADENGTTVTTSTGSSPPPSSTSPPSTPEVTPTPLPPVLHHEDTNNMNLPRQQQQQRPPSRPPGKFADLVFTRKFSTFDRQNPNAANSPFHGFFTLFWMGVFLFVVKIGAENWRRHGSPLGTNEIMRGMFSPGPEVVLLLAADGAMCALTGVSWVLQVLVKRRVVRWEGVGWVLQNIWQAMFIAGVIGLTMLREWPWTHTVFFVLHGLVMLMKQHSYAFYNGHLSTVYHRRLQLLAKLKQLERIAPVKAPSNTEPPVSAITTSHLVHTPSAREYEQRRRSLPHVKVPDVDKIAAAIESREPLDETQVQVFERVLKWEVDALSDELRGKSTTPARAYPNNLTLVNHYEYIVLPTVVYELEYPRSDSINWYYAAEKLVACFGIIFVMIVISQAFIYPVVMDTVRMKEEGVPLAGRFRQFPWMLSDLIFPFMMEYLLTWYLIWETILNLLAELTYFADRSFYGAWWNCVSWDQFARDWNRPVHNFLLRHVYHSSISAMRVDKHTATLITFFLSACVHELVMWCIFKKLRGYLLFLQMCQLPLVRLSRTKWLRHRATLGNMIFWLGIFTGPSILCSLYLIL